MKKKVIAGLLGTAMVASLLAGCGSSNNTTDTTADTAATEAAADTTADTAAADAESEAQSVADAAGDVDLSNADVAVMYYTSLPYVQHWMLNWTNWVLNIRTTMQTTTRQHRTSRSIQLSRQVQTY